MKRTRGVESSTPNRENCRPRPRRDSSRLPIPSDNASKRRYPGGFPWSQNLLQISVNRSPTAGCARSWGDWSEAASDAQRAELAACLREGPLLLALRELPAGGSEEIEPREWTIRFVSSRELEGATWLCVFADAESAGASAPGAVWIALEPAALLRFVRGSGYAGLLLEPRAAALRWTVEELEELLIEPDRTPRRRPALSLSEEPENAVREALERLAQRPYDAACARVRESRTGKHVQFALTPDGALMLDLPRAQLGLDEAERARILLDDLSGNADAEGGDELLQALFCDDLGRAAKATLKILHLGLRIPAGLPAGDRRTGI